MEEAPPPVAETTAPAPAVKPAAPLMSRRFRQFLPTVQSGTADEFADKLLAEVSRYSERASGEDLDDDITVVAIHVQ